MIDARGYSCPIPVVMVQREVKSSKPASLEVLVDNPAARENVSRFAEANGYAVSVKEEDGEFRLLLSK